MTNWHGCTPQTNAERFDAWRDRRAMAGINASDPLRHDLQRTLATIRGRQYQARLRHWARALPVLREVWAESERIERIERAAAANDATTALLAPPSRRRAA